MKTMKVKGIKKGHYIELLEEIPVPDGQEISLEISPNSIPESEQWKQLEEVIGACDNDQEITNIFEEIDQQRHREIGRDINF